MEDQNKSMPEFNVIDEIHAEMHALAVKHNIDLWFSTTSKFPVMKFMFDNGEKDVTIELDIKDMMGHDIKKYIEEDVEEYIVDIFGLKNGVEAE